MEFDFGNGFWMFLTISLNCVCFFWRCAFNKLGHCGNLCLFFVVLWYYKYIYIFIYIYRSRFVTSHPLQHQESNLSHKPSGVKSKRRVFLDIIVELRLERIFQTQEYINLEWQSGTMNRTCKRPILTILYTRICIQNITLSLLLMVQKSQTTTWGV